LQYSGPVERRKPEEFAAQQASGGADNSDEDEDVPAASGSGINSGGAPITASGNMSLRGRDEWKEVTVPSYDHLSSPVASNAPLQRIPSRDGTKPNLGPVDPRLGNRPGTGMSASSLHLDHDAAFSNYRLHARESEEIMEQQRRAEQYRYLQMQAQLGNGVPPYGNPGGPLGHLNMGPTGPPSWMGMGRNRQRSDMGDMDMARSEHLTSWAALRENRTPSSASLPLTGGSQPALNALYSQRLGANAQGQISPNNGTLPHPGGSDTASHGLPSGHRHGLPEENISAGEFADATVNPDIGFYTPYTLPTAQGISEDGTFDWQRSAAAAQLQAAMNTQAAQLAYLRQQKAQQMQWKDLVAASGMDYAVNHFNGRMGQQNHNGPGFDHGQYTPQNPMSFQPSVTTDSASGGSASAPPTGGFSWPTEGQGGPQAGWFNNLNQQPSALRNNVRVPGGSSPIGMSGGVDRARDPTIPPSHNAGGDSNSLRADRSSIGGSQDDMKPAEMTMDRKRQYDGDTSDMEADSKRNRSA
jgi:hypothetical protein